MHIVRFYILGFKFSIGAFRYQIINTETPLIKIILLN